jgi:hypothetical protein
MPPPIKPMLGDLELSLVQQIETDEAQALVDHAVPGLAGNFTQRLNRKATQVTLHSIITGDEARDGLEELREKFHAAEPLPFVADIMTATEVQQVLISDLEVQEVAGKPDRFEYWLTLKEYVSPPPDETATIQQVSEQAQQQALDLGSQQADDVSSELGVLEVQVDLGGGDDYSGIAVAVEGTTADGERFATTIEEETGGIYRLEGIRADTYTVRAVVR